MARLLVHYAHPGHKHSHVNRHMARAARSVPGIDLVDLYSDYPRHSSLRAPDDGRADLYIDGYRTLLEAIRDDRYDLETAASRDVVTFDTLPIALEG